jgi:hypothetical protein
LVDQGFCYERKRRRPNWKPSGSLRTNVSDHEPGYLRELRNDRVSLPYDEVDRLTPTNVAGMRSFEGLEALWPVHMLVDYIRVYQDPNAQDIGCDPADMPTASYIQTYNEAYTSVASLATHLSRD